MRKLWAVALMVVLLTSVSGASAAAKPQPKNFIAILSGASEVPAVDSQAHGIAIFHLNADGTELSYMLIVANINDVLASHIHLAPADENGPVVVPLYTSGLISGRFSGVLAMGTITDADLVGPLGGQTLADLADAMMAGNTYVNVHTSEHKGGEIRGQIRALGPGA